MLNHGSPEVTAEFIKKVGANISGRFYDEGLALRYGGGFANLYDMPGDCTSMSIYFCDLRIEHIKIVFPILLPIMSMNCRLNGFFSIRCTTVGQVKDLLLFLEDYPIVGKNVYRGGREEYYEEEEIDDEEYYMVSGILKCVNPEMIGYDELYNLNLEHDYNDTEARRFNELQTQFGLKSQLKKRKIHAF